MHSLNNIHFWLWFFIFTVPLVKNDLMLRLLSVYWSDNLADVYIRYTKDIDAQCFACVTTILLLKFLAYHKQLPDNWTGGRQALPLLSRVCLAQPVLSCAHYLQVPATQAKYKNNYNRKKTNENKNPTLEEFNWLWKNIKYRSLRTILVFNHKPNNCSGEEDIILNF